MIPDIEKFRQDVHRALRSWHKIEDGQEEVLTYLRLVQSYPAAPGQKGLSASRLAVNAVLLAAIDVLALQDEMGARILQLRFPNNCTLRMVANQLNVSEFTVSRLQRSALDHVADVIYQQEMALQEEQAEKSLSSMPPASYTQLFGLDEAKQALTKRLMDTTASFVVVLTGLGGIGKTALADAVTRACIQQSAFSDIVWLRSVPPTMSGHSLSPQGAFENLVLEMARHFWDETEVDSVPERRLSQVRQQLKQRPYLVVIDNLESETDTAFLLSHLSDLAKPSKFLLTARVRPAQEAVVFTYSLDELSYADSVALMHHHAQELGVELLAAATDADYRAIWGLTGGHPLALKLVVSLLDVLPLRNILAGLSQGNTGKIEQMYRYIYWQTWQTLSENGRNLLLAMPLVAQTGGTPDYLSTLSGLSEGRLWAAVQELRSRSLLEVRGTLHERRYGIHRLTETFLNTEIIHWPEDDEG